MALISELDLRGRRALVCGASRGIGAAVAAALAELGASVCIAARDAERLATTRAALATGETQTHSLLSVNFNDLDALSAQLDTTLHAAGAFEIVVNNSGGPPGGTAADAGVDEYVSAFRQHLGANQVILQHVVPGMRAAGYGRIVNIISTSVKAPIPGLGVSNTIRAAVAGWAKTLATELGPHGITVNNVLPGYTDTTRLEYIFRARAENSGTTYEAVRETVRAGVPARRFAQPEEIAAAVAFLASPAAAYINGINLPVDGGRLPSL